MNKFKAVIDFVSTCPLVGQDMFFNFVDETEIDGNTSLLTDGYGQIVKKYVDGLNLKKMQFVVRQVKPLSRCSNTSENVEQMQFVQELLEWVNEQGKKRNFPDFGEKCVIESVETPEGVEYPMLTGVYEGTALYSFPFEIIYVERT